MASVVLLGQRFRCTEMRQARVERLSQINCGLGRIRRQRVWRGWTCGLPSCFGPLVSIATPRALFFAPESDVGPRMQGEGNRASRYGVCDDQAAGGVHSAEGPDCGGGYQQPHD